MDTSEAGRKGGLARAAALRARSTCELCRRRALYAEQLEQHRVDLSAYQERAAALAARTAPHLPQPYETAALGEFPLQPPPPPETELDRLAHLEHCITDLSERLDALEATAAATATAGARERSPTATSPVA